MSEVAVPATESRVSHNCCWTDEEVETYRRRYVEGAGALTCTMLAVETGKPFDTVSRMIQGQSYKHVVYKVPRFYGARVKRRWDNETVLAMRREYRADDMVSTTTLAAKYGGNPSNIIRALTGITYSDVEEPLDRLRPSGYGNAINVALTSRRKRRLAPEVALFIRLQYRPGKVTEQKLAEAYKVSKKTINRILNKDVYVDVPHVPFDPHSANDNRIFTREQVLQARKYALHGTKSTRWMALHWLKASKSTVAAMIKGHTYADLPNAVPESIWSLRRKKRTPFKMPRVRLLDHDERVDLVTMRAAV